MKRAEVSEMFTLLGGIIVAIVICGFFLLIIRGVSEREVSEMGASALELQYSTQWYEYVRHPLATPKGNEIVDALTAEDDDKVEAIIKDFVESSLQSKLCWQLTSDDQEYEGGECGHSSWRRKVTSIDAHIPKSGTIHEVTLRLWS